MEIPFQGPNKSIKKVSETKLSCKSINCVNALSHSDGQALKYHPFRDGTHLEHGTKQI